MDLRCLPVRKVLEARVVPLDFIIYRAVDTRLALSLLNVITRGTDE